MSGVEVTPSLARSTVNGIAVRAVGMALGLIVTVLVARQLAAEEMGAYQGVLSLCIILGALASATADRPASRRIAALDGEDSAELPTEIALAHLVVGIAVLVIMALVVVGSLLPGVDDDARVTLRCAALVAPGVAILTLRQWIALPLQGVAASLGPEQIGQPIVFLGLVGLAASQTELARFDVLAIYAVVCWLVWLAASWRSGLLELLRVGRRGLSWRGELRSRFAEGRPFILLTAVGAFPIYATIPLAATVLDLADVGRLAIAIQLTALVAVPLHIVSLAIMPRCARLHRENGTAAIDSLVRRASTISCASGLVLAALLMVSLDTILNLLGPSFAATTELVPVLVFGQVVNAALGPNGPTLQMIGSERAVVRVETAATMVLLVAVALAAAAGSVFGAALAVTATTILRNLLMSATLYRRVGILTLPQLRRHRAHHS